MSTVLRDLRRHSCSIYSLIPRQHSNKISFYYSSTRRRTENRHSLSYAMGHRKMPLLLSLHRLTYCSQSPPLHPGPHCQTPVAETMSCHGRTGKRRIEHFPLLHRPRAWNQLPTEPKRTQSTSAFRRRLKTLPFNSSPTYCSE